jgi:hypothetical protein
MKTAQRLAAYALTASMLVGSAGVAIAQTATGTPGTETSTSAVNRTNDRNFDWGWLGLLGLVGLAGLMRRDRAQDPHHQGLGVTTR